MNINLLNSLPTWFTIADLNASGLDNNAATAQVATWEKAEMVAPIAGSDFYQIISNI